MPRWGGDGNAREGGAARLNWVERGDPGNVDLRTPADRRILVVDRATKSLYEPWNSWYDVVLGAGEIDHVFPASHRAGSNTSALPFGARLRLKPGVDISGYTPEMQRIFRAWKKYGLIFADNGSDMYISGTHDNRWDDDVLNPAFRAITAGDFDVVELGWNPPPPAVSLLRDEMVTALQPLTPALATLLPLNPGRDTYLTTVVNGDLDPQPVLTKSLPTQSVRFGF